MKGHLAAQDQTKNNFRDAAENLTLKNILQNEVTVEKAHDLRAMLTAVDLSCQLF